jgi:hypothetical protein
MCSLQQIPGLRVIVAGTMAQDWKRLCGTAGSAARRLRGTVTLLPSIYQIKLSEILHRPFALLLPAEADDEADTITAAARRRARFLVPNVPAQRGRFRRNAVYCDTSSAESIALAMRQAITMLGDLDAGATPPGSKPAFKPEVDIPLVELPPPDSPQPAYDPDLPLHFLHIPKTAGTSIRVLLEYPFPTDEVCYAYYPDHLAALPRERLQACRLYRGHFGPAFFPIVGSPVNTFTWMRSPLHLLLSNYTFSIQQHMIPETMRLDEWLELNGPNPICDFLTRGVSFASEDASLSTLDKAKGVLRKCFMMGLVERYEDSLNLLCYHLNTYPPELAPTLNRSRVPTQWEAHPAETRRRAEELVREDEALYAWAKEQFMAASEEMLEALRPEIKARFGTIASPSAKQVRSVLRDRFFCCQTDTPLQEEINYTFDQPLIGEGWYERQPGGYLDPLFGCLRGIAGETCRATLYLPIARNRPCTLRFGIARIYTLEALNGFGITVNGVPIPIESDGSGHPQLLSEQVFRAEIPASVLQKSLHLTQIAFLPGGYIVPAERDPLQHDTSALTVALNWVGVKTIR